MCLFPYPIITVHWLNNSRAQRILWLLEELGLNYEVKRYFRHPQYMFAPAELRKIHPLGKSPVVTIEDAPGSPIITLAESSAIVEFILERYGNGKFVVKPTDRAQDRALYLYWLHFAEGSAMIPLLTSQALQSMPKQTAEANRPLVSDLVALTEKNYTTRPLKLNFASMEAQLQKTSYFAGEELTGADFMMVFVAETVGGVLGFKDYPAIKAWYEKLCARPAYQAAEKKGEKNAVEVFFKPPTHL